MLRRSQKIVIIIILIIALLLAYIFFSQIILPHKSISFTPEYKKISLSKQNSFDEIFIQTGLGKSAAQKVIKESGTEGLKEYQEIFFAEREVKCQELLSFFTKSDRLGETKAYPKFADIKPGDIVLTLSNHSLGWRHGHAGIIIDDTFSLESPVLGENVTYFQNEHWLEYSQFAVLRLKDITPESQEKMVSYCENTLEGVPYKLTSGLFGNKAPSADSKDFGVHCSYLVWYLYNNFGVDIDSDGGRLVTTKDILNSPELEVVQIYGIDPRTIIK